VRGPHGAHRQEVLIDERRERFEVLSEEPPAALVLDPDQWVLKEMQ